MKISSRLWPMKQPVSPEMQRDENVCFRRHPAPDPSAAGPVLRLFFLSKGRHRGQMEKTTVQVVTYPHAGLLADTERSRPSTSRPQSVLRPHVGNQKPAPEFHPLSRGRLTKLRPHLGFLHPLNASEDLITSQALLGHHGA